MPSFGYILREKDNIFKKKEDIIYFLLSVNLLQKPCRCTRCLCLDIELCENKYYSDNFCWTCSNGHTISVRQNSPFEEHAIPVKTFVSIVYFWAIGSDMAQCINYLQINDTIGETVMRIVNKVCHRALIRDPIIVGGYGTIIAAKVIPVQYLIPFVKKYFDQYETNYQTVECYLLILLEFYREKPLLNISVIHDNDNQVLITNIYRHTQPGTIIHIDNSSQLSRTQHNNIKYRKSKSPPSRSFESLTTRDIITLGEFVTQYISKNTNMNNYLKCQLYKYIEHVMYRFKSAAKRPPSRSIFEDFMIEYASQHHNIPNRYMDRPNENDI